MSSGAARAIRTVSIVGARPQFVKLSPVSRAMKHARLKIDDRIVHTGQHYDDAMSKIFFEELEIPQPAVNCGVGSGPQGRQTARMLESIEARLMEDRPDAVIVYGDTNSTLAGALVAAKLHIPVAHVEAGLRSFNRRMPEELNRVVTDHLSEILFAPTKTAIENLSAEGLRARALLTGDVMYDAVLFYAKAAAARSSILRELGCRGGYGLRRFIGPRIRRPGISLPCLTRSTTPPRGSAGSSFRCIRAPLHFATRFARLAPGRESW